MSQLPPEKPFVFNATQTSFEKDVLERSRKVPIVLDFWAAWCGPCRALGPLLESLCDEYDGRFLLAKVDIDAEPMLASQFRVQSIPLVLGLFDAKVVSEFMGAQPEPVVRQFIDKLCPSEAQLLARQAAEIENVDPKKAWAMYEKVTTLEPGHTPAWAALAEMALNVADYDRAADYLAKVGEGTDGASRAANVRARLAFRDAASHLGSIEDCKTKLQAEPDNLQRKLELGLVQAAAGHFEDALETLIEVVETDKAFGTEHAKAPIVQIFGILGQQSETTNRYRSRLAAALY